MSVTNMKQGRHTFDDDDARRERDKQLAFTGERYFGELVAHLNRVQPAEQHLSLGGDNRGVTEMHDQGRFRAG
jgi:hypothetical protein